MIIRDFRSWQRIFLLLMLLIIAKGCSNANVAQIGARRSVPHHKSPPKMNVKSSRR